MPTSLTQDLASKLARIALGHVAREYPNAPQYVLASASELAPPSEIHPIFYGSFDWHSCVHGYWLLARVLRRFPQSDVAPQIRELFARQLTPEKGAREAAYFARPLARGFERPYGWAWALMLASELAQHTSGEGKKWAMALRPLTETIVKRFLTFLPLATYPVRAGVHSNTAFALVLALNYAETVRDTQLATLCKHKARAWYISDRNTQAWEPSQDEFLSSALMEATCCQAALPAGEFETWFDAFLPRAAQGEPTTLFIPATVSDRSDGKIAHLDGLNLSRAWCWRRIANQFAERDDLKKRAMEAFDAHVSASLPHVVGDYMGEHWLATYAVLALDV